MSIETRISRLVKKTGVKKSRWTVPLRYDSEGLGGFFWGKESEAWNSCHRPLNIHKPVQEAWVRCVPPFTAFCRYVTVKKAVEESEYSELRRLQNYIFCNQGRCGTIFGSRMLWQGIFCNQGGCGTIFLVLEDAVALYILYSRKMRNYIFGPWGCCGTVYSVIKDVAELYIWSSRMLWQCIFCNQGRCGTIYLVLEDVVAGYIL
jgi:hypothetical protein